MYVYSGKLTWLQLAENECFTVVFLIGFALHDPVSAHWQWSKDSTGQTKVNTSMPGIITAVSKTVRQYHITVPTSLYTFEMVIATDRQSITLTMRDPSNPRDSTTTLDLKYADSVKFPTTAVYTGKLNYPPYASNEMITLIAPAGITEHGPAGLYYQWTVDAWNSPKRPQYDINTLLGVRRLPDGAVTAFLKHVWYNYSFTFSADENEAEATISSPNGRGTQPIIFTRVRSVQSPVGAKKALIIRFDTGPDSGIDNGIFLLKEMLTKSLAFDTDDVEMLYFDVDKKSSPKSRTGGQDTPTATRFRQKLVQFLSRARPGDVRFLYVDAHGMQRRGESRDAIASKHEGWKLAADDAGMKTELVPSDWVKEAIRKHLKDGVNLTIFTSSFTGVGILDGTPVTPGILVSGCHETQFNAKALRTSGGNTDPWIYAITMVIKRRVQRKRAVPSYTAVFNEAKAFIRKLLDDGFEIDRTEYLGPSPNETQPVSHDLASNASHQDPQLIFNDGFIDPDVERFLFPITAPAGGDASQVVKTLRYPRDEF